MATADSKEDGAPGAGGAGRDDAPVPQLGRETAAEENTTDHAPMAHGASQEGGEAGQDEVSQPQKEQDSEGEKEAVLDVEEESEEEEEDGDEGNGEEDEGDEEEDATHLPFAPTSEVLDDTTTVDPSYTISLIRKLIPQGSDVQKQFSAKHDSPEEEGSNSDGGESTQPEDKDVWEECGCVLWDLAASKPQAELMMNNLVLEVLLSNIRVTQSPRVKELSLGIMGNLACHESLVNAICLENGLIATVVEQLFVDDTACLSEAFRLLAAILRGNASMSLAEALLPEEILSRILWIFGNTRSSTLLEKTIDFISTIIDDQDAIAMLIQPFIKVGLVERAIDLLTSVVEKSQDENKLERSGSLDLILHFMEELSAIHSCSEVMSSSDKLINVLTSMVKSPDKREVASHCASVVIIISNVLADGKHLVPLLSDDLPFLEGLFDILPLVSDDDQARYAIWCLLSRFLAQAQDIKMSSLDQFASLFLGKFSVMKDDLESHVIDAKEQLSAEDAYMKQWTSTSLRAISSIMERWIGDESSEGKGDAPVTGKSIDNARNLLTYCGDYQP